MFGTVYGSRIENCIIVYSIYKDRKNAVSVIVGKVPHPSSGRLIIDVISTFLEHHPMFA
jgi:desulfoferrodoxin (superoxide reductase-like protein)